MTALARGLAVLGQVAEHGPLSAEDIAAGTDLPLSTAYRYISELVRLDYLTHRRNSYELGSNTVELIAQANRRTRDDRIRVVMAALARTSPSTPGPLLQQLAGQVLDALDVQADGADRAAPGTWASAGLDTRHGRSGLEAAT